eukprot:jgi/Botrbrau1/19096/Bobra.0077s0010.1
MRCGGSMCQHALLEWQALQLWKRGLSSCCWDGCVRKRFLRCIGGKGGSRGKKHAPVSLSLRLDRGLEPRRGVAAPRRNATAHPSCALGPSEFFPGISWLTRRDL